VADKVAACGELTAITAVLPTLWLGLTGDSVAVRRLSLHSHSWRTVAIGRNGIIEIVSNT
jgi:hypothetical protein